MFSGCRIPNVEKANHSKLTLPEEQMADFKLSYSIAVTVTCVFIILSLVCGLRAALFSTKLPRPFRQLCKVSLVTNILLMILTAIQPWIYWDTNFDREYVGTCSVLVSLATLLVCLERVFALKFPLKYIRCSGDDKFAKHLAVWAFLLIISSYLFVRFLVCYMVHFTIENHECMPYQVYSILSIEGIIVSVATVCFGLVCHAAAKNKRQHTRRITRMGLPQNHALSATDTHVSATLFVLYPFAIYFAIFSVLCSYWPFISDSKVLKWLSVSTRMIHCAAQGILFNSWFDEWRLHFVTIISPLSANLRDFVDIMRISVYNIVVAEAVVAEDFDGSRLQLEGSIKSRRVSRSRISNTSKISTISAAGSLSVQSFSLKSPRTSTQEHQEQNNRPKSSRLESITETEA